MIAASMIVPGSSTRLLSIEDCRPELQELHRLWRELRGERRMPARRDFDPADARRLLPHLMLIDVFPQSPRERRFRVRLHGTAQVDYQGADWTGCYPHQKTDRAPADRLCEVGDQVVASREPWMSTGTLYWLPSKPWSRFETILLPLSDDDETVNMLLGLTVFF
ncbi:PAS domain-containing protein [Tistlia consotensis]|uniref:PAS domain-containing protein n=1 Tax=Tistlia consotensis USBA 355 TaxID=560819 RepID=A0A1Y6BVQ6_9PROT|nr:PAS domain-containing protein [Tistlia consotensis]SMF23498.1 PAS domain-containing protein [Tistlia consotensis USBA 355]SNR61553.1 PAS domain-containing protein [Tistlia consotensis]